MQVSIEAGKGLERKLSVQLPADAIEKEVDNRLNSLKNTAKVDGFRPGKVPLKVVKQKYAEDVLQDVSTEMMHRSFRDAITQEKLRLAGNPVIDIATVKLGQALEYTATFEVFPEVKLSPLSDLKIEKAEASVEDGDIDKMLEVLRKQDTSWKEVKRASKDGDKLTMDFVGSIDGEEFDGGSAKSAPLVLGSKQMIPGFEKNLLGLKPEQEKTFKVSFPKDYGVEKLAGQEAEFSVTVQKLEAPELPKIDEEFAKKFGIADGDVAKLKVQVRTNMENGLSNTLKTQLKNSALDALLQANTIEVPIATIDEEIELLQKQAQEQSPNSNLDKKLFADNAKRRVQLGLLLAQASTESKLKIDAEMVKQRVEDLAKDYDDPQAFVSYYMGNQEMLASVHTMLMEEKVVDWIVEQATISTKNSSFDEIMNPDSK